MTRPSFTIACVISLLAHVAHAQTAAKPKPPAKPVPAKVNEPPPQPHTQKDFGLAGVLGYMYIGTGAGLSLWKTSTDHNQFGVSFVYGNGDVTADGEAVRLEYMRLITMQVGGFGRFFVGDTFNIATRLNFESYKGDYGFKISEDYVEGGEKITSPFEGYGIGAELSLGNLWRWDSGLLIGCDWVGLNWLLHKDAKAKAGGDTILGEASEEEKVQFEKDVEKLLSKVVFLRILMVHVGYEF